MVLISPITMEMTMDICSEVIMVSLLLWLESSASGMGMKWLAPEYFYGGAESKTSQVKSYPKVGGGGECLTYLLYFILIRKVLL